VFAADRAVSFSRSLCACACGMLAGGTCMGGPGTLQMALILGGSAGVAHTWLELSVGDWEVVIKR